MALSTSLVLAAVLTLSVASDLRTRTIPDGISLGGAAALAVLTTLDDGASGLARSLTGCALAVAAPAIVHLMRPAALGGGDVKLALAIGAGLGPVAPLAIVLAALSAVMAALCRFPFEGAGALRAEVAFAPYLAAGALATLAVV